MNRRGALFAGAAVAALGAGAGVAWWRRAARGAMPAASTGSTPPAVVWGDALERPEGGTLDLASLAGHPLLLNFWATWCPPCVREMPLIDAFARARKADGWSVVGIAVDKMDPVRTFLAKQPVSYAIGVAGLDALGWVRSLGNVGGGLPFTVLFDASGAVAQRKIGEIHAEELEAWASVR